MKYSKAAAVVVGSLVALGAASVATTAQAAEPVPGGGVSGNQGTQPTSSAPTVPNAPSTPSDPVSRLTGQKLPISKLANNVDLLKTASNTPTKGAGNVTSSLGGGALPIS